MFVECHSMLRFGTSLYCSSMVNRMMPQGRTGGSRERVTRSVPVDQTSLATSKNPRSLICDERRLRSKDAAYQVRDPIGGMI